MIDELCNPITKKWVSAFINRPKPMLLIDTESDIYAGLDIANYILDEISGGKSKNVYNINNSNSSIGIEEIRDLQKYLRLKADISNNYSRFVIISSADKLTVEAQNSLLKIFEEMPESTIVILVTSRNDSILPTILSRCFSISVLPLTKKQCDNYAKLNNYSEKIANKAYLISDGRKSAFLDLINDNVELDSMIDLSKQFISSNVFERQKILQEIYKKEIEITEFIQSLKTISRAGMKASRVSEKTKNWKRILISIETAEEQISNNVQLKLAMLSMSISI
jgi:DNA polymerase III delta prime subunit